MVRSPASVLEHGSGAGRGSRTVEALGRAGLLAKGAVYAVVGLLAVHVALLGRSAEEPSARGAIEAVAGQPFGKVLLALLALGLLALGAWRAVGAISGDPVEGSDPTDRIRYGAKALIYLSAASTAVGILLSSGDGSGPGTTSGSDEAKADSLTTTVLGWPAGRWLVAAAALALVAVGLHVLRRRVLDAEMSGWIRTGTGSEVRSAVVTAGRVGYAAWVATAVLIAVFLLQAALTGDPAEAVGVSGALSSLGDDWWGQAVLFAIASGLLLLGAFHVAMARYRRM